MPRLRFQPPDSLPGTTAFSKDDDLRGTLKLVRLVKSQPWVWDELSESCSNLKSDWGRKRIPGNWELVAVAFVCSRYIDIQPWWDESSDELWRECGFAERPTYRTTWRRLRELEQALDAFLDAIGKVIRHAREHDPRVLAHVHFDGTEDETHAALVHACPPGECPRRKKGHSCGGGRVGSGRRPRRVSTEVAQNDRQKLNEKPPAESSRDKRRREPEQVEVVRRGSRFVKRLLKGGCWYETFDLDGGMRAYAGPRGARRFWHGYYNSKATCHLTRGSIPIVESASRQEYHIFDDHYDLVCRLLGEPPQTAIGDKGYSIESVFRKCTTNGTAPIFSWRSAGGDGLRHDKPTHDRHGVPRCKHCGGPTQFVRFYAGDRAKPAAERRPRIGVRCLIGATAECTKDQTIACGEDWRLLLPLWRTDALYHELKESHQEYEGVHRYWRERYKVGVDHISIRPKARGIGWHRLRAYVACLVDWLRILLREGWLGSARRNHRDSERGHQAKGEKAAKRLIAHRYRIGLMQPYGERAFALSYGQVTPPSRRPRGTPPNQQVLDVES